ncbi:MAG: hypothetical protein E6I91_08300 [Chloroflexi bacterium]|nr:MAG: hypothetical protein E6I91_08300 [Chloroflexota bacterium]
MMFGAFGNPDHDESIRIIHKALDAGINFIDTADGYSAGESEEIVGKALAGGRRENVVLAVKFGVPFGEDPNHRGASRRWITDHLHRDMAGTIKTLTVKREGEHFYAVFTCEMGKPEALPVSSEDVGIDLGITHFAALSTGEFIDNPHKSRQAEKKLTKLQTALSRKKRGSHRRNKAVQAVAKAHRKIRNQRADFLHTQSRKLVNRFQVIVFEDLQTENLLKRAKPKQDEDGTYLPNGAAAKAGLNQSISDAGWGQFMQYCTYKHYVCTFGKEVARKDTMWYQKGE